jgi:hypothetical protein
MKFQITSTAAAIVVEIPTLNPMISCPKPIRMTVRGRLSATAET